MVAQELSPAEFCSLERALVTAMTMRKKRHVEMQPVQTLKLRLLEYLLARDVAPEQFEGVLGEAVLAVTDGLGTGPAQAVASDLAMDWDLACRSPGFVAWLRQTVSDSPNG